MGSYDDIDAEEIILEPEDDAADEQPDAEAVEELHFEDQKIRGYEDVISDLDQISSDDEDEIADKDESEASE
jgi:hypothetical protein